MRASERRASYLATHRELPPAIAEAIDRGHVVAGMSAEQVQFVLGEPRQRRTFGGESPLEIWIYGAEKFHQDPAHSHGASLFRLVLLGGRLILVEPL
jgi:hypothetical protein